MAEKQCGLRSVGSHSLRPRFLRISGDLGLPQLVATIHPWISRNLLQQRPWILHTIPRERGRLSTNLPIAGASCRPPVEPARSAPTSSLLLEFCLCLRSSSLAVPLSKHIRSSHLMAVEVPQEQLRDLQLSLRRVLRDLTPFGKTEGEPVDGATPGVSTQSPAHSVATGVLNAVQLVLGIDCRPMTEKRSNHHYTDLCDHYPVVRQFALHSRGFGAWEWKAALSDPASIDAWFATAPAIWTSLSALHKKREIRGYCLHTSPADSWVPTPGQTIRFVGLRFESLNGGSGALTKFIPSRQRWAVRYRTPDGVSAAGLFKITNLMPVDSSQGLLFHT